LARAASRVDSVIPPSFFGAMPLEQPRRWRRQRSSLTILCLVAAAASVAWGLRLGFVSGRGVGVRQAPRRHTCSERSGTGLVGRRAAKNVEIGEKLQGVVESFNRQGAILDVGKKQPAFLHVAEIQENRPPDAEAVLSIGQKVEVRVFDFDAGEIKVSMRANQRKMFSEFKVGEVVRGTVTEITKRNVFLDIGAMRDAALNDAEVGGEAKVDLSEVFSKGDQVDATILKIGRKSIDLTMSVQGRKANSDFQVGQEVEGTVVWPKTRSVYVDIGAMGDVILWHTQVEGGEDQDLSKLFKKGQKLKARIHQNGAKGISLTMLSEAPAPESSA